MSVLPFGFKLPFDDDLGRDAGMIGTDNPVCVVTQHSVISNQRIHQSLLEGMTHMQGSRNIGWRQLDTVIR